MKTILAISGSLREQSKNSIILENLKAQLKDEVVIDVFKEMGTFPHFNPDLEFPTPPPIENFRERLRNSDAVLISTPEYAHGIPGSLKNALDWIVGSGELMDKKIALLFSSSSEAMFVQVQLFEVIKTMSADIRVENCLKISGAAITPEILKIIRNLI